MTIMKLAGDRPAGSLPTKAGGVQDRQGEQGFALPAVMLAVVLISVLGAAAIGVSRNELLAGKAMDQSGLAFYAAESGIASTVTDWNQSNIDDSVASPGDSLIRTWQQMDNGCSFRVAIHRIDGGDSGKKLYAITSTGRGVGRSPGQRQVSVLVTEPNVFSNNALTFGNDILISGNPTITGSCSDVHANGDIEVTGTSITAGSVGAVGTVDVSGALLDTLGNPVTPNPGASQQAVPDYDPMDYCLDRDATGSYHFDGGQYWKTSVSGWRAVAGIGWKYSSGIYTVDSESIPEGVYCAYDGDLEVSKDLGTAGSPKRFTFLTTMSLTISGNPVMTPYHSAGWMVVASGDVKINGNPTGGEDSFQGVIFAGAQCEISGSPNITGQIICRGDSNPSGSQDWVAETKISGDLNLTYDCTAGTTSTKPRPLSARSWTQIWN